MPFKEKQNRKTYYAAYYRKNKQMVFLRNKQNTIKKLYGLSWAEYQHILSRGKCDICGDSPKKLCIDHCHTTRKIRGLLCDSCNIALGKFKESQQIVEKALNYLRLSDTLTPMNLETLGMPQTKEIV